MSIYVDNFDTSQIQYYNSTPGQQWVYLVTDQAVNVYNNSLSAIAGPGSAVFRFTGSSVDVYGTEMHPLNGAEVISHYTLDQQIAVMHISNDWVVEQDGIPFYTSGDISYGDHVLVISVMQASDSAPYCLDYISYSTSVSSSSSSSLSSSSSSLPSSSTSSAAAATNTTDTGLPTISATSVVEKSNVNVIVGGVIGGAVGLIATILVIVFFCFGRRVLQRHTARKRGIRSELPTEITPYFACRLVSSPHMSEARSPTPLQASRAPGERSSLNPLEATPSFFTLTPEDSASSPAGLGTLMVSPSGSRLSASHKSGMPEPVTSGPPAAHHADSGLRFRPETTSSEVAPDVPPLYTSN